MTTTWQVLCTWTDPDGHHWAHLSETVDDRRAAYALFHAETCRRHDHPATLRVDLVERDGTAGPKPVESWPHSPHRPPGRPG